MKLKKDFLIVPDGLIYPILYKKGEDCPPEHEAIALSCGAISKNKSKAESPEPIEPIESIDIAP